MDDILLETLYRQCHEWNPGIQKPLEDRIIKQFKEGFLDEFSAVHWLNGLALEYHQQHLDRLEALAEQSELTSRVLEGETTYTDTALQFRKILKVNGFRRVGHVFKRQNFDGELYQQLVADLKNVMEYAKAETRGKCSIASLFKPYLDADKQLSDWYRWPDHLPDERRFEAKHDPDSRRIQTLKRLTLSPALFAGSVLLLNIYPEHELVQAIQQEELRAVGGFLWGGGELVLKLYGILGGMVYFFSSFRNYNDYSPLLASAIVADNYVQKVQTPLFR